MHFSKKLMAGAAVALALITGSAAYAAIPDGGGVIHGCYNKTSGQLRVTDPATNSPKACTKLENPLNWNQQGPASASTRDVLVHKFHTGDNVTLNGLDVLVTSLTIPPPVGPVVSGGSPGPVAVGAYAVSAHAQINASAGEFVWCWLMSGNTEIDQDGATVPPKTQFTGTTEVVLMGAAGAVTKVDLHCSAQNASIGNVVITATPVDNVYKV